MTHPQPLPDAVMHLIPASGGGIERFARDLATAGRGHHLLHWGKTGCVVEDASEPAGFHPYAWPRRDACAWLARVMARHACTRLHVHHLDRRLLQWLPQWRASGQAFLLSLHDLGFLNPRTFELEGERPPVDPAWQAACAEVLSSAHAVTVPSAYLAAELAAAFPQLPCTILAPGVRRGAALTPHQDGGLRTIGVLGALGPHKGRQRLLDWLAQPWAANWRWVLVGYLDQQLHPGLAADGRLWVHGPFRHQDTRRWLDHYQVDLLLFPNRLAESFSYALSDAWAAGRPVLVPDCGALGARVREHGGGALIAESDDPAALGRQLQALAADGGTQLGEWCARIRKRRTAMVPGLASMRAEMAALYRGLPQTPPLPAPSPAWLERQDRLRLQLDGVVHRQETIRLARDLAQHREWSDKLCADIRLLHDDLSLVQQARAANLEELHALAAQAQVLRAEHVAAAAQAQALQERNQWLESTAAALKERNTVVETEAAGLAQQDLQRQQEIAELHARNTTLSAHIGEQQEHHRLLATTCERQAVELAVMQQRISALEEDWRWQRLKAMRYERMTGWIPGWLRGLARRLLQLRRSLRARTAS